MNRKIESPSTSDPKKQSANKPRRGPGPGRPTREQARKRSLELLETALDLFLENGYEGTTMEGIAAAVGMAKRTVYAQYRDKYTLFKASLHKAINEWIIPVEVLEKLETEDLEETLVKIGQVLVSNILTPAGLRLLHISNTEGGRLPEIGTFAYEQGTRPTRDYLADLFRRRLCPHGSPLDDPDTAAMAFLHLVVGGPASLSSWGNPMKKSLLKHHTKYCVSLFLHGMLSGRVSG